MGLWRFGKVVAYLSWSQTVHVYKKNNALLIIVRFSKQTRHKIRFKRFKMSQACMLSGKLVQSRVLSRILSLVQRYLGTRMAVFTLEKDYPSETGYPLDNSRQIDNTS